MCDDARGPRGSTANCMYTLSRGVYIHGITCIQHGACMNIVAVVCSVYIHGCPLANLRYAHVAFHPCMHGCIYN